MKRNPSPFSQTQPIVTIEHFNLCTDLIGTNNKYKYLYCFLL